MGNLTMKDVKPQGFKDLMSKTLFVDEDNVYKPLLNKRILVLSSTPEKINYQIKNTTTHPIPVLFGRNGRSNVIVQLERDAF